MLDACLRRSILAPGGQVDTALCLTTHGDTLTFSLWLSGTENSQSSNMKLCSEMLLEVTVYCGKVRDQRGCQNMKYTTVEASWGVP